MISVALTTFNGQRYIKEQLCSILAQTYQDFEVIIVDDCSKDNTFFILEDFAKKDKRIKIFKNEQNLGFKKNFEKAISLCHGEYIALSDQDDIWFENHLELLSRIIGENSLACGNALLVDADGNSMNKLLNSVDGLENFDSKTILYKILLKNNCFQGASMLIEKKLFEKAIPIPSCIPFHDVWFACCAFLEKGVSFSQEPITKYRQHGKNVTFFSHNKRSIFVRVINSIKKMIKGIQCDRFLYVEELEKLYGDSNVILNQISSLYSESEVRITPSTIRFLYNHYTEITTREGHKGFIKDLIKWSLWRK